MRSYFAKCGVTTDQQGLNAFLKSCIKPCLGNIEVLCWRIDRVSSFHAEELDYLEVKYLFQSLRRGQSAHDWGSIATLYLNSTTLYSKTRAFFTYGFV